MPGEGKQQLELLVCRNHVDESYYIAIVKDNRTFRLNGSYLTVTAARFDLDFLVERLKSYRFEQKGEMAAS